MSEQRTLPWPALLLLMTVVGGYIGLQRPLRSSRPAVSGKFDTLPLGAETVPARMWQDPFKAVQEHQGTHESEAAHTPPPEEGKAGETTSTHEATERELEEQKHELGALARRIAAQLVHIVAHRNRQSVPPAEGTEEAKDKATPTQPPAILILPVMVSDTPYAEDVERRLGSRYAVISALNVASYRPENATHIGFVETRLDSAHQASLTIPYEWFELDPLRLQVNERLLDRGSAGESAPDRVLVLWLRDGFFSQSPLARINELFEQIRAQVGHALHPLLKDNKAAINRHMDRFWVRVLGPGGSTVLKAFIVDAVVRAPGELERLRHESNALKELDAEKKERQLLLKRKIDRLVTRQKRERGKLEELRKNLARKKKASETERKRLEVERRKVKESPRRGARRGRAAELDKKIAVQKHMEHRVERLIKNLEHARIDRPAPTPAARNRFARSRQTQLQTQYARNYMRLTSQIREAKRLLNEEAHERESLAQGVGKLEGQLEALKSYATIYSPRATAPLFWIFSDGRTDWASRIGAASKESKRGLDDMLDERAPSWAAREKKLLGFVKQSFEVLEFDFVRTIHADDKLMGTLIDELGRRGVDVVHGKDHHVVLVSESDTFYGRALPATFAAIVQDRRAASSDDGGKDGDRGRWPEWIHAFSYLRGIDGKYPSARPAGDASSSPAGGESKKAEVKRPEGSAQFDYLRRLVSRIKRLESAGKDVKAIGVLGSDVYDKLLVLQALRASFPGVVFFTTDLDARLFHPNELKWTRNLVVASSFGLQLHEDYQRDVPPFRSTYQTGLFSSCLAALDLIPADMAAGETPRVFEIGSDGPHDLTPPRSEELQVHPPRTDRPTSAPWILYLLLLGAPTAVALWLFFLTRQLPDSPDSDLRRRYGWVLGGLWVVIVVLGVVFARCVVAGYEEGAGEPWSLTEGISIWPTSALRLLVAFLSVLFVVAGLLRLKINADRLTREYALSDDPPGAAPGADVQDAGDTVPSPEEAAAVPDAAGRGEAKDAAKIRDPVRVQTVWKAHVRSSDPRSMLLCSVVGMLAFILLGRAVVSALDSPFIPHRGDVSRTVDFVVLMVSLAGMLTLVFFVSCMAWNARRFLQALTAGPTCWPEGARKKYGGPVVGDGKCLGAHDDALAAWLNIQLIARRTEVVGGMVFYPFAAMFLMLLARSNHFDSWDWPLGLLLVLGVAFLIATFFGFNLRIAAERARRTTVARLEGKLVLILNQAASGAQGALEAQADALRHVIGKVTAVQRGAFAPLTRSPLVVAILFPFGGMGTLVLVERLVASL